ncbi:MAG: L-glyceraldehyde 3-phosphate reductase [Prolixibacteraceae bacterium]|jgi:L-glyceraldehyde 3-phosphate reductase|nr:L-glyceraldehyde 3-phosphate reductase [Prolixibacteraceae bacterium]
MYYIADTDRYDRMPYKRCGKSGLKLPAISLGLWQNFGGADVFENGRSICKRAFDMGITHFDLANNYGPPYGSAEENFGKILRDDFKNYRDELVISTKAGYDMWAGPYGNWGSRKYMLSSLDQSLKRMGLDYVDIFYSHRPDPETPLEETMGALAQAVKQGKALYVGISNYPADLTTEASKILKDLGTPCLVHQARYSLLDRWVEGALLDNLEQEGIGCIAFSPLAQGLLTDRYLNGIPGGSRATKSRFLKPDQVIGSLVKVRQLNEMAIKRGQRLAQMSLAWILKDQRVTSVLVGASSLAQLETNVNSLYNLSFSNEELEKIDTILSTPVTETKRTLVIPPGMMKGEYDPDDKNKSGTRHDFIKNLADRLTKNG